MIPDQTEIQLMTAPMRSLRRDALDLDRYIFHRKWRWAWGIRDDFSWVYGLSEVEICDFLDKYEHTKANIENIITVIENGRLKDRLIREYNFLPDTNAVQYMVTNWFLWLILFFVTVIRKTIKTILFRRFLDDVARTSERMINYIENAAWLEMVPEKE